MNLSCLQHVELFKKVLGIVELAIKHRKLFIL